MTEAGGVYSATTEVTFSNAIVLPLSMEITYYIIGVVCVITNFLTIVVIVKTMDITKTLTNCLILNQSIIDLFCGIFLILTTAIADPTRPMVTTGDLIYCKIWLTKGPTWAFFTCSSFNLVVITMERLIAIKYPIWYKMSMTRGKIIVASVLVWVLGIVIMIGYAMISTTDINGQCFVFGVHPELGFPVVAMHFFIPTIIFIVVYSQIAFILQKRVSPQGVEQDQGQVKRSRKIIVTLVKVVVCFVFCWSWNEVYYFLYLLRLVQMDFASDFYHFSVLAIFCNCCCNPIVYTLSYRKFQVGALKLLGCPQDKFEMENTSWSHRMKSTSVNT